MHYIRARFILIVLLASVIAASCGRGPAAGEEAGPKIRAEAYLFDAQLRRDGKPTSFRLELVHADSIMALAGRGFLGKTGMRGYVTRDSLLVLFPREGQFLQESIAELLFSLECGIKPTGLNILDLFRQRPDSIRLDSSISVTTNPSDDDKPAFLVYIQNCPWQIELTYDLQKNAGWRVREFSFFDGKKTYLQASRREFKSNAHVRPSRFAVRIPSNAERIEP